MRDQETNLLSVAEAGRILKRSAKTVREYHRIGKLEGMRTQYGMRLFRIGDVERLAEELREKDLGKSSKQSEAA